LRTLRSTPTTHRCLFDFPIEQLPVKLREPGRKVATAQEARKLMKIGVWYDSVDETLQNLGMPPNREGGEPGFMVWDTDGTKSVTEQMSDSHPMAYCMTSPETAPPSPAMSQT
jgi:hypothetical protein